MKLKPKKSLGQNFLVDDNIINIITNLSNINNNSTILEIGPGTGNLTEKLISKRPQKMILVEKDKNLCQNLKNKFNDKVEVINKDFLDLSIIDKKYNNLSIFLGSEEKLFEGLKIGCNGIISATCNVTSILARKVYDDFKNNIDQSKNEKLCNVRKVFEKFNLISSLHSYMSIYDPTWTMHAHIVCSYIAITGQYRSIYDHM